MDIKDEELKQQIKEALYMHGKLALIFYKMNDTWVIHKWGEFDQLLKIHAEIFAKYLKAGFEEQALSLTLIELPNDVDTIFEILACGGLEKVLKEIGVIENKEEIKKID